MKDDDQHVRYFSLTCSYICTCGLHTAQFEYHTFSSFPQVLLQGCKDPKQRRMMVSGCQKLVSPKEMGERFKFLAMLQPSAEKQTESYRPAGFQLDPTTF